MQPDVQATADILAKGGVHGAEVAEEALGVVARIQAPQAEAAMAALLDDGYDFLVDVLGADIGEAVEVTWHVRSLDDLREVFVKAAVPYDGEAPSVWRLYPASLFAEREEAEMFGISFAGHPNPKRLLTSEELGCWPLRKSVEIRTEEEVTLIGRDE